MITALQKIVINPKSTFLLFDETQHQLFLNYAVPLIQAGISVGPVSPSIVKSLGLKVEKTTIEGVYTVSYEILNPSILCFSSGAKNNQKGIVRSFESWQNSFALIQNEITDYPNAKGVVVGALPYSLSLFGAVESLQRKQQPKVFPNHDLRHFTGLESNENYIMWMTPFHASFFAKALAKKQMLPVTSVRYLFVGGAGFLNSQRSVLQQVFPNAKIYSFYGASETSFIAIKHPCDSSKSVGVICKGVQVSILDDHLKKVPNNTKGTIWINTQDRFTSYFQKSLKVNTLNSFVSTNDIGFVDNQNRLFFTGRSDRYTSISGHIIDIYTIEVWFKEMLTIETLAILPQPNTQKENELVLLTTDHIASEIWHSIKKAGHDALGAQGVPKKWVHCPSWPVLANGKTDLKTLKKWL